MTLGTVDVLKNGTWNKVKYEGSIEELQVINILTNASLPVYATGDSNFNSHMEQQGKPFKQTTDGLKFYELVSESYESIDFWLKEAVVSQKLEVDQYGINKIYADKPQGVLIPATSFKESEFTRHYASGKPDENSYECEYKDSNKLENEEVTFYCQINGFKKDTDTMSIKLLGNKHSDGSKDKWLIFQLMTDGKNADNFQIEDPHPTNHDNHQTSAFAIGESIVGKVVGFKAVTYIDEAGKRHAETWLDFPTDFNSPANKWRKYIDIKDVESLKHGFLNATNGGALLRIDGTKKGDMPTTKFMSIREIIPQLATGTHETHETHETDSQQLLYESNRDGKWNDGQARVVKAADGDINPNGKGLEMHASGNPQLEIDGKGTATLVCQPGHGRAYVFVKNYNGILEEEVMFDANVENHTIQTRSRHQEGGAGPNRFGGLSAKISPVDVGLKIEKFHNEHLADTEKNLEKKLELGKWYKVRYTFNDTADGKGIFQKLELDYNDGAGFKEVISQTTTSGIEPYFQDKASFEKNSYFWLRMNNTKPGRLGFRNLKLTKL